MMTRRVRRRRRRRRRRQPLPQFGGLLSGSWIDRAAQRGAKGLFRLTNYARRQKGGRINAYIKRRTSM